MSSKIKLENRLQASRNKNVTTEDRMTKCYMREDDVIAEVKATLETLKGAMIRVKTDGVKTNVDRLAVMIETLIRNRDETKAECRALMARERTRADLTATDN